ncbi:MAG: RsmE family RNA methyltransferase [Bacilli bacterium]|jgi:16S rRNA (uracil1498-N3)-methyltransferase|nr:RsmE family RNA methyltransferase [Bacilli bacterium]
MQRYFGQVFEGRAILNEGDAFHLSKVMRCSIGTEIEVVADGRVYLSRVEKVKPLFIKIINTQNENNELPNDIVLIMAPLKGDKTNLVLQKATELGVSEIILLLTSRTIVRFKQKDVLSKLTRFNTILKEAAEQSQRIHIPLISYTDKISKLKNFHATHKFVAFEQQSGPTGGFNKLIKQIKKRERIAIVIGPEGGFANEEIDELKTLSFIPVSLGKRILRAETASIYALSVIANYLEN